MSLHETHDAYRRYRTGLTISLAVVVVQMVILAVASRSIGLFEDMVHGVADNLILIGTTIVLYFEAHGAMPNQGRKRVLALLGGALLVLAGVGGAMVAFERIMGTQPMLSGWVLACTSFVAMLGGGFAFWVIHGVHKSMHDHLHASAVAHLIGDLAISGAVFLSALAIIFVGVSTIDSWVGLFLISPWMIVRGVQVLRYKDPPPKEHAHHDGEHHH